MNEICKYFYTHSSYVNLMMNMSSGKKVLAFLVLLLLACGLLVILVDRTLAIVDGFTHAVLDENFGWPS